MATATETYIKDVVASLLSTTRSNLLHGGRGGVGGGAVGGRAISLADMRFALEVSSCNMGYMPDIMAEVQGSWKEGVLEGWDDYGAEMELDVDPKAASILSHGGVNGFAVPTTNSLNTPSKTNANGIPLTNGITTTAAVNGSKYVNGAGEKEKDMENQIPQPQQSRAKRKRDLANGEMEHFRGVVEGAADGWVGSSTNDRDALVGILDECLSVS